MSTLTVPDLRFSEGSPAEHLRRTAAAVRVHLRWWGVRKTLTTQQKEEIGLAYAADARFLTAGKKIIDIRHEAFKRLTSLRTRIIQHWHKLTLPYVEAGVRLIKQADIEPFVATMEGFRAELAQGETDLDRVYADIKADARRSLGRLYDPTDYPPSVRGLFGVDWDFPAVEPPNYLMRLNPEIYQQEQERVARRFEEAVSLAEQAFVSEFSKLVTHLTERLSDTGGEKKVFRDSAVTNIREFFDRFRYLSVRSNEDLERLVDQAQRVLGGVGPQDLRDSDSLRQDVTRQLTGVQAMLDGMLVDQPRRRILRSQPSNNGAGNGTGD
jgi:hypothetical protein